MCADISRRELRKARAANVAWVERFIADRHSCTVVDERADRLVVRQVDEWGRSSIGFG
jgi:hypothetical protein